MHKIKARVRRTHNYGFNPAGTIVHVDQSEIDRLPEVLERVEDPAPADAAEHASATSPPVAEEVDVDLGELTDQAEPPPSPEHSSEVVEESPSRDEGKKSRRRR